MAADYTRNTVWLINQRHAPLTAQIAGRIPNKNRMQTATETALSLQGVGPAGFHIMDVVRELSAAEGRPHTAADVLARIAKSPTLQSQINRGDFTLHVGALDTHRHHAEVVAPLTDAADRAAIAAVGATTGVAAHGCRPKYQSSRQH